MILKRKKKHLAHDGPVFFLYSSLIETRTMLFREAWWQADYSLSPASDVAGCMHDSSPIWLAALLIPLGHWPCM